MRLNRISIAFALSVVASAAVAQNAAPVDCTNPANRAQAQCAASNLPVPGLATNAAPLLLVPLGLLVAAGAGGGGGGGSANSTFGN